MTSYRFERLTLFLGDVVIFYVSLWLMLAVRYGVVPSAERWAEHVVPFSILFAVWLAVFYIAGLYQKHTSILKRKLVRLVLYTQLANIIIAVAFFYFVPFFQITPKTNLFIYLVISSLFVFGWRRYGPEVMYPAKRENAVVIGSGDEVSELMEEVNNNKRYRLHFISSIDLDKLEGVDVQEEIISRIYSEDVQVIAIDLRNEKVEPILPHLYNLIFSNVQFIDMHRVYEEIFDRIPLSLLRYNWFLENISAKPHVTYDAVKRAIDLAIAVPLGLLTLPLYPFVWAAVRLEDGGPLFITQRRIGQNNEEIEIVKFRSMKSNDGGRWLEQGDTRVTNVGAFLRKSRIDELPQLWNVIKGDVSLIGPRPDIHDLGVRLRNEIPFYTVRNIIKPGLSGWAQIMQDTPPQSLAETRRRLSYDLYYIKNRSLLLDVRIALRTIKTLLSRAGM